MTISTGRWGLYGGKLCWFTQRDPHRGTVWTDDLVGSDGRPGRWVDALKVKWRKTVNKPKRGV